MADLKLSEFSGIDNVSELDRLGTKFLREAVNVDITDVGRIRRRVGFEEFYSGAGIRSVWSDGTDVYFAEGTSLKKISGPEQAISTVGTVHALKSIAYTKVNAELYYTDGISVYGPGGSPEGPITLGVGTDVEGADMAGSTVGQVYEPLPGGTKIVYFKGRLWVARGSILWYSEPMALTYTRTSTNYFMYPSDISVLAATDSSLFVVADKTYSLRGSDPRAMSQVVATEDAAPNCLAIPVKARHFGKDLPDVQAVVWMGAKGVILGLPDGSVVNLTEPKVAVPSYESSAVMFSEREGLRQVISTSKSKDQSRMKFSSDAEAEIRRNGVIL